MTRSHSAPPEPFEGTAIVYCEGAFDTPVGKTAHGLVRRSQRYRVAAVIDSHLAGRSAAELLAGARAVPVVADLPAALAAAAASGHAATHMVVGMAPDGGRLEPALRAAVRAAIAAGLHVVAGLHDFLADDTELAAAAAARGVTLVDVRRPPPRDRLHFFTGCIEEVSCPVFAVLGTDSAVGKRTTAWLLVDAFNEAGVAAELVGTGQTAWLQGARYGICLDALVNDFVAGEIEHAVHSAWHERRPGAIVVEGQGSLLHPAYPGGFEILAAARPRAVILQHAPGRRCYDGFPAFPLHPLERQLRAVEIVGDRPVAAIALNTEGLDRSEVRRIRAEIERTTGRPTVLPLQEGAAPLLDALRPFLAPAAHPRPDTASTP